jgi:hypothetical protein
LRIRPWQRTTVWNLLPVSYWNASAVAALGARRTSMSTPEDSAQVWRELFVEGRSLTRAATVRLESELDSTSEEAKARVLIAASPYASDREALLLWLARNRPGLCFQPGVLSFAASFWRFRSLGRGQLESLWLDALQQHGLLSTVIENLAGALWRTSPRVVEDKLTEARALADVVGELRYMCLLADFHERRLANAKWTESKGVVEVLARKAVGAHCDVLIRCDDLARYADLRQSAACLGSESLVAIAVLAERIHREYARGANDEVLRNSARGLLALVKNEPFIAIGHLESALPSAGQLTRDAPLLLVRALLQLGYGNELSSALTRRSYTGCNWQDWIKEVSKASDPLW